MSTDEIQPGGFVEDGDTRLMMRLAAGEEGVFDEIVERFQRQVYGVIYRYIGNSSMAEDCAQEVFLRLYRMRKTYRPSARVSTLIYRITANLCLNAIRDTKRRRMLSLDAAYGDEEATLAQAVTAAEPSAEEKATGRERAEIVRKALTRIPDRQRIALVLHRFEGLSYADIAETMETNVDAIKALLSRARASLAMALKSDIEAGNL